MDLHTLFSDKSDLYQSARPSYPGELYQFLSSISPGHQSAWDCACGSGQAATGLVEYFQQVHASDVSTQQVAAATPQERINYFVCAAERSPLAPASMDLVCVAQALHWFDLEQFWPELDRVLKPDGVFACWGYNFPLWVDGLDEIVNDKILGVIAPYWPENNQLLWNHYRDIEFPYAAMPTPKFRMAVAWNLYELFDLIHTFSATRRCMADIGDEFFVSAFEHASRYWRNHHGSLENRQEFELDFVCYVGHKPG